MKTIGVDDLGGTRTTARLAADAAADWSRALPAVLAASDRLTLVAQPIIDLAGGVVAGYELLSRFVGPPSAPPDVWFAEADRHGFAAKLTTRVIERALLARPHLPAGTFLTVNVEPHVLCAAPVRATLRDWGRLDRVVIELTEHAQLPEERLLRATLDEVRGLGAMVAVDDVGTGYAGLHQLMRIRPDIIKLDRELISGLDTDPVRRAVVRLLGDVGSRMDAWILAEGVETGGELQALTTLGVPLAQGWLLGRPAPDWPGLDGTVLPAVRHAVVQASQRENVAHLVRQAPVVPADQPSGARTAGTVLVDPDGRPVAVLYADGSGAVRQAPAMSVAPAAELPEVARRAMNRPVEYRGVPLVCTDTWGVPTGTVDVAELVEALAAASTG